MAKRFQFRLETVLRVRRDAQEAQQRRVADAARAVRTIESQIEVMARQMRESLREIAARRGGTILDVDELRRGERFRAWLDRKVVEAAEEASRRREQLEVERRELAEAHKQVRVIETLRARQWQRHRQAGEREERQSADEAAAQQHRRSVDRPAERGAA